MQTSPGINTPLEPINVATNLCININTPYTETCARKKHIMHVNKIMLLKFNIFLNMTLFNLTIFAIIIKKNYLKHI